MIPRVLPLPRPDVGLPEREDNIRLSKDVDGFIPDFILDYLEFHRANRQASSSKYLIWSCSGTCGGIGDRLRGMMSTFYLAIETKRIFLIHNPTPFDLVKALIPTKLYDWRFDPVLVRDKTKQSIVSMDFVRNKQLLQPHKYLKEDVVYLKTNQDHDTKKSGPQVSYFLKNEYDTPVAHALVFAWFFQISFKQSKAVESLVNQIKSSLGLLPNDQYVAVHMRFGGGAHNADKSDWVDPPRHSISRVAEFSTCSRRLRSIVTKMTGQAEVIIFVASDNVNAKVKLQQLDSTNLTRYSAEPVFHIDRSAMSNPAALHGYLESFAEFFMLLGSTCLVSSRSGFSEMAASASMQYAGGGKRQYASRCVARYDVCNEKAIDENLNFNLHAKPSYHIPAS